MIFDAMTVELIQTTDRPWPTWGFVDKGRSNGHNDEPLKCGARPARGLLVLLDETYLKKRKREELYSLPSSIQAYKQKTDIVVIFDACSQVNVCFDSVSFWWNLLRSLYINPSFYDVNCMYRFPAFAPRKHFIDLLYYNIPVRNRPCRLRVIL